MFKIQQNSDHESHSPVQIPEIRYRKRIYCVRIFHPVNSISLRHSSDEKRKKKCVEFANHKAFPSRALVRQMSEKICCLLKHTFCYEVCIAMYIYARNNKNSTI